jgi:serine/threonine protein phosphatase PrpC
VPTPPGPADHDERSRVHTDVERAFVQLANGVTHLHPDDLPGHVERCAALLRGREATLWLVDIDQRTLRPFPAASAKARDVDEPGTSPGTAYRTELTIRDRTHDGTDDVRLWIPLMDSAERLGVLGVVVAPGDDDVEVWAAFASVIGEMMVSKTAYGDSIVRARRTREVSLAAEMRWSLLPPLSFTSPQVEVSGVLEPAYDIAGDTFDYAANGDVLSLAVLDAMGHGLEASQIANLAVSEYRRGRRRDRSLDQLLHDMDEAIASQFGDHRFVTGQLAELDLVSGTLTVVNAGHPAPLVFRDGSDAGDLPCRPCPPIGLGMVDTLEARVEVAPDDVILFHTDGITESRSPDGEQFGRDRLAGVVVDGLRRRERPAEVLRRVVHAVAAHTDGPMQDDATAIFVRRGRPGDDAR